MPQSTSRSLVSAAGVVAAATVLTRASDLVREQVNAAVFGVGSIYGAFQYAGLIPNLCLTILGGLNGPLHSATVTMLAGRSPDQTRPILATVSTLVGIVLVGISIALFLFTALWIDLISPRLAATPDTRSLAILQLRIMAPVAWFGGMTGINIGILTTANNFWLPTISPLLSSLTMIAGVVLWTQRGTRIGSAQTGATVLAWTVLAGAVLQWGIQWLAQRLMGLPRIGCQLHWRHPAVRTAFQAIGSALLLTSVVHANWYVDLAFTSWLPSPSAAASALTFAHLLFQSPLGIINNILLVPLLPLLARSAQASHSNLRRSLQSILYFARRLALPMTMLIVTLAWPYVAIIYERGAFATEDTALVGSVLCTYGIGLGFSLIRGILLRVLYAMGANHLLFQVSLWSVGLNIGLNGLLLKPLGIVGLALGTGIVNLLITVWMLVWLECRLKGLVTRSYLGSLVKLTLAHGGVGFFTWRLYTLLPTSGYLWEQVLKLMIATLFGLGLSLLVQHWADSGHPY